MNSGGYLYQDVICKRLDIKAGVFSKYLRKAQINRILGRNPKSVDDFVKLFVEKNGLKILLDGKAQHSRVIEEYGLTYGAAMHRLVHDRGLQTMLRILHSNVVPVTEPLGWLRVLMEDLSLGYSWAAVETAFLAWAEQQRRVRFFELYDVVGYHIGLESAPEAAEEWGR